MPGMFLWSREKFALEGFSTATVPKVCDFHGLLDCGRQGTRVFVDSNAQSHPRSDGDAGGLS